MSPSTLYMCSLPRSGSQYISPSSVPFCPFYHSEQQLKIYSSNDYSVRQAQAQARRKVLHRPRPCHRPSFIPTLALCKWNTRCFTLFIFFSPLYIPGFDQSTQSAGGGNKRRVGPDPQHTSSSQTRPLLNVVVSHFALGTLAPSSTLR